MIRKPLRKIKNVKLSKRIRRKLSIRKKVAGTSERLRICAVKTNKHLLVQVVDDTKSSTLFSVQTFGKNAVGKKTVDGAKEVGAKVAEKLRAKGVTKAVFDRNGYKYSGIISALADSVRASGIQV